MEPDLTPDQTARLDQIQRMVNGFWIGMMGSTLLTGVLGSALSNSRESPLPLETFRYVLGGLALGAIAIAWYLKRYQLTVEQAARYDVVTRMIRYRNILFLSLFLAELPAGLGMMMRIAGLQPQDQLAFTGLAFVALMYFRPDTDAMRKYVLAQKES